MKNEMFVYRLLVFMLPYVITTGLSRPDLFVTKQSNAIGDDRTTYQVNITIQHSQTSFNDSFDIEVTDEVYNMEIVSIYIVPQLNSRTFSSNGYTPRKIIGIIPRLKLKESASMIYNARFLRDKEAVKSVTRTKITWSNESGNPKLGPKYSETTCVKKQFHDKNSFIGNYGFVVLGVVLGIASGCIIAFLLIICLRRHPSTKKYILHTDEVVGVDNSAISQKPAIIHVYYDYADTEVKEQKKADDHNFFRKLTGNFKTKEVAGADNVIIPPEIMWRSCLFKGDILGTGEILNSCFNTEYMTLLEFTLKLWICIWKSTLGIHIEKLLSDGQINIEMKNKCSEKLNSLFQNSFKSCEGKDIKEFMDATSDTVLKSFCTGASFYNEVLGSIKIHDGNANNNNNSNNNDKNNNVNNIKNNVMRKTKDPDVLKQLEKAEKKEKDQKQKEMEELKHAYVSSLNQDFASITSKLFSSFCHVSSIFVHVRLATISTALLLVVFEKSIDLIHYWLKHTLTKDTDLLKRKRLLSDDMDSEFQDTFRDELEQLVTHLLSRKRKIIEMNESNLLSAYLNDINVVDKNYSEILSTLLSEVSSHTSDNNTHNIKTVQELIEKFTISLEYANSYEKIAQDKNIYVDFHSNFLEELSLSLNIFISRMKTHVDDIYNNKKVGARELVDDLGSFVGDPVELLQVSEVNYLAVIISNIGQQFDEIINKLSDFMKENVDVIHGHGVKLKEFHNGLLTKRNSDSSHQVHVQHILLKCAIQCHGPLSWEGCLNLIETSPKFSISALCEQNLSSGVFLDFKFSDEVEKIMETSVAMVTSSIVNRFELINNAILREVESIHDITNASLYDFIQKSCSFIQNFEKRNFSSLFYYLKRLKLHEYMLELTCVFLTDILSNIGINLEMDQELMDGMSNFRKISMKIMKTRNATVTKECEKEVKLKINNVLEKYISTCGVVMPETHKMSEMIFNVEEICNNLFEIGKQQKYLEDKLSMVTDLIIENCKLITMICNRKYLSEERSYMYLKYISCLCLHDVGTAYKVMLDEENVVTMTYIVKLMIQVHNTADKTVLDSLESLNTDQQE